MQSTLYSCPILTILEFSVQIFEKSSNIKFPENPSSGSRVVPYGRTDGHDEANIRFFAILRTILKKTWMECKATDTEGLRIGYIVFHSCLAGKKYYFWPPKTWRFWGRPNWSLLWVIPYQIEAHLRRVCQITCSQTDRQIYASIGRPFNSFWLVKTLTKLADEPTLYVWWRGEGVCFVWSANPLSVWLYADSLLAFLWEISQTKT